jgi:diaminopimelate decarboxylase
MTRLPLSHWSIENTPNGLTIEGRRICEIAQHTPFYIFNSHRLRKNIREAKDALKSLPDAELYYSIKTNPYPTLLSIIAKEINAEVISSKEAKAAISKGFDKIIFNGPGKSDNDLRLAISINALIQVESLSEAEALVRIVNDLGKAVRVGIRINPDIVIKGSLKGVCMGSSNSVFGLDPDGHEFDKTIQTLANSSLIKLESLSAHIGTGINSVAPYKMLAARLISARILLSEDGIKIPRINLGGGFPVQSEVRYLWFGPNYFNFHLAIPPEKIPTFRQFCTEIKTVTKDVPVIFEPGRLLVSDCFHLVTRVIRIKHDRGTNFAIVDASKWQNAQFVDHGYHEVLHANQGSGPLTKYTISGPLCADFDVYAKDILLTELSEGDLIVILDVGAYNLSAQSGWSFEPARVVEI